MQYSIPYLFFVIALLLIATIQITVTFDSKTRRYINCFALILFIVFWGFRGLIGWDWYNYFPYFRDIKSSNIGGFEIGFAYYTYWIKSIFKTYELYTLIGTLINAFLLDLFFRRYIPIKYYVLGLVIYVAFSGFALEIDLLRNVKSILLFMISLRYIEERRFIIFLALNFIGLLFHWTTILLLPLYFILHKPISVRIFILIFIVGNFIFLFQISYVKPILLFVSKIIGNSDRINDYITSTVYAKPFSLSIGYFIRQFMSILIIFYYDRILRFSKYSTIFINLFFILMILYLFFAEVIIAITRFSLIFNFSYCFLIPVLLEIIQPISTRIFVLVIYYILILTRVYTSSSNIFYKYDNSLLGPLESYQERKIIFKKNYKKLLE